MIAAIVIITLHTLNNHHNAQHLAISCATDWSARNTLLVAAIRPTRFSLWLPISLCRDQACCDTVTAKQQANGRCVCATSQQPHTCAAYGSHPAHPMSPNLLLTHRCCKSTRCHGRVSGRGSGRVLRRGSGRGSGRGCRRAMAGSDNVLPFRF